jgi:hypothetical protein
MKDTNSMRFLHHALLSPVLVLVLLSSAYGHVKWQNETFGPVPESSRSRLIERLNLLIEYQRTHQWDRLYDLLYDKGGKSRKSYISKQKSHKIRQGDGLVDFTARSVIYMDREDMWVIAGCARWHSLGRDEYHSSSIYAKMRDGEWYLSQAAIIILCGDTDSCTGRAH